MKKKPHFQVFLALGLIAGFLLGQRIVQLFQFIDALVGAIVFFGFLTRPFETPGKTLPNTKVLLHILLCKVALPIGLFYVCLPFEKDMAIGLLMVAALPAAAVSPILIKLLGGDMILGLKLLLIESLFVCLSIPMLFHFLAQHMDVSVSMMATYISLVLMLPLCLSEVIRRFQPNVAQQVARHASTIGISLITVLLVIIAAKIAPVMGENMQKTAKYLAAACVSSLSLAFIGYLLVRSYGQKVALCYAIKNMFINIGLGIGVAAKYLTPESVLFILSYTIIINLTPQFVGKMVTILPTGHQHQVKGK